MKSRNKRLLIVFIFSLFLVSCKKQDNISVEYRVHTPILDEETVDKRVFQENMETFYELQKHYSALDYRTILQNVEDGQLKEVDGVEYRISIKEYDYRISYFDNRKQQGEENLPEAVSKIRELI